MAVRTSTSDRLVPAMVLAVVMMAFAVGVLWNKVDTLESGGVKQAGSPLVNNNVAGAEAEANPSVPTTGKLSEAQAKNLVKVDSDEHINGNKKAKVFLIEYSDFECPFCERFHATTKQVLETYGNDVALVYRHFPLEQIHPKAKPAAIASECVAKIGGNDAFWKFADVVFADQTGSLSDLSASAAKAGVDKGKFDNCFADNKYYDEVVKPQMDGGSKAGVTGTPGNLIVNQKGEVWLVPGAIPFDQLKVTIDEALAS